MEKMGFLFSFFSIIIIDSKCMNFYDMTPQHKSKTFAVNTTTKDFNTFESVDIFFIYIKYDDLVNNKRTTSFIKQSK